MASSTLPYRLGLRSEADTVRLAACLAEVVATGDTLLLDGTVGAGKSAFARALIRATLARDGLPDEDVPSPTFTLVQTYPTQRHDIWHADLYRVTEAGEVLELGLADAMPTAVCLVEWPDRLGRDRPSRAATLRFEITGETTRDLSIFGGELAGRLAAAAADCPMTETV
ncbi:MAG: tRNA (adenosine(37)-N6)-threonylcarbamoyltransferase complex ATPase subunit type 1 TsaE [Jannaschia sp.]